MHMRVRERQQRTLKEWNKAVLSDDPIEPSSGGPLLDPCCEEPEARESGSWFVMCVCVCFVEEWDEIGDW